LPGLEADWLHVSSAKVESEWSCFSSPQDAFMACTGKTSALCVKGSRQPSFRHYSVSCLLRLAQKKLNSVR